MARNSNPLSDLSGNSLPKALPNLGIEIHHKFVAKVDVVQKVHQSGLRTSDSVFLFFVGVH